MLNGFECGGDVKEIQTGDLLVADPIEYKDKFVV